MPIVFIHGVNTRIDESFHEQRLVRGDFIDKFLKPKLPKPYSEMDVVSPFWGDDGSQTGSSVLLPSVSGAGAEAFGSGSQAPERADERESYHEILDTLLGVWGSMDDGTAQSDADVFESVTKGIWDLRQDEELKREIGATKSRQEALNVIDETLSKRLAAAGDAEGNGGGAESYGLRSGFKRVRAALDGLFSHPYVKRPLSSAAASRRDGLHARFALFLGDVFVYLKGRGNSNAPGPIVKRVLAAFERDEPTLVVTHSMGGNIFYDVVTHFAPKKGIAAWLSVGGQVGFFEYQRLFLKSVKERFTDQKVDKPIAGPWLNVYDPIDPFAFLAEPVFHGVEDFKFVTGSNILNAHSDYFIRPDFYTRAGVRLGALLRGPSS